MLNVEGQKRLSLARHLLLRELERRCQQNPKYSLRAFAKALDLNPAMLSMVISGKRNLSKKMAKKIAAKLALNPDDTSSFISTAASREIFAQPIVPKYRDIALDQFATISDWYHYGILSLVETKNFKPNFQWIASRLGISVMEAKAAVERLERMELLDTTSKRWSQIGGDIMIENEVSTAATRHFQSQMLKLIQYSLENDPPNLRDISSITMAIRPEDIHMAKEEIRKFKIHLMNLLEKKGFAQEVYSLTVQLFPVSRNGKD